MKRVLVTACCRLTKHCEIEADSDEKAIQQALDLAQRDIEWAVTPGDLQELAVEGWRMSPECTIESAVIVET